uniref:AMOP domain protein n=1 Tax=Plectus sambesii TaxID=2011161 RepID=A0A914XKJ5_9BILA
MRWWVAALAVPFLVVAGKEMFPDDAPVDDEPLQSRIAREAAEDYKYPEEVRKKRQISREQYQQYIESISEANYDMRSEEGWQNILYPFGKWVLDDELMGQAGRETQSNLGFDCPFYGYRFNYTFVYPSGFVSFGRPPFLTPPFTFPNPRWPQQRDHSFIAPFYADSMFQWVGNTKVSNVFFRSVHRPTLDDDAFFNPYDPFNTNRGYGGGQSTNLQYGTNQASGGTGYQTGQTGYNQAGGYNQQAGVGGGGYNQGLNQGYGTNQGGFNSGYSNNPSPFGKRRKKRQMPGRLDQPGMVVDPWLLDNITNDVQSGYTGANGWRAEHAFIVTWYRMAYGGAPRAVDVSQFEYVKQWQNTFQMVIASDEIRTFVIFNYARLNWTSSNEAGGLNGFGGKQAAMAGFNGGNGTGWYPLPYAGHGRIWKLGYFSNVLTAGRWIHRVDEQIIPGGCTNASIGRVVLAPPFGPMQGGVAVNISGPCLREGDFVKVNFENWGVNCERVNRIRARCVMPMFHKTGLVPIRMSRDGGLSFPFVGVFYVLAPHRAPASVLLRDDVQFAKNRWQEPWAEKLSMQWQFLNLTYNTNARIDINIWGYWEDADRSHFVKIDSLVKGQANNGYYEFSPRTLARKPLVEDAWRKFHFGFVQVAITDHEESGVLWSKPTPFPWYHLPYWEDYYGDNWATDMCIEWFEYDGRRRNFIMDLTWQSPCPCKLEQALLDLGRYMPLFDCDRDGDTSCPFNKGAQHCVQSVVPSWTGASQQCCYDYQNYLMFTDDWEPDGDYTRFFQPATPSRAHNFGSFPYKRPPYIPSMSHYQLDLMPYRTCCDYAQHCEFYYWRRQTNGCQDYRPPAAGYIYGEPHVVTFDGTRYTFPGKGYYVLVMSDNPIHRLMIQVRLEQPDDTLWRTHVNATVVTGVAIQENDSSIVQVFARKPMRRWRYKMDVLVDGLERYFDTPHWKYQQFNGLNIRNPRQNMNQSEIIIMLNSGAGVRVAESYGMLDVMVFLPPSYNSTCRNAGQQSQPGPNGAIIRCYTTMGLLGAYNNDPNDDLVTLDGSATRVSNADTQTAGTVQMIYEQFGRKWFVDGRNDRIGQLLFQDRHKPIYNPLLFASPYYIPEFWPQQVPWNATLIFSMNEVVTTCMGKSA